MGRKLANHNSKLLKKASEPTPRPPARCNCQKSKKQDCPVPDACNQDGAIYQASVATNDGRVESYVGLARNFKKRFSKHKATLQDRNSDGQTTLSKYVWRQRDDKKDPKVTWKFLEKDVPDFNPITGICKLCTREKFQIVLNPSVATLNSRTEVFSFCKHKQTYLIGDPPD